MPEGEQRLFRIMWGIWLLIADRVHGRRQLERQSSDRRESPKDDIKPGCVACAKRTCERDAGDRDLGNDR